MHHCARKRCTTSVAASQFACRRDWYALSETTRDDIYETRNLSPLHPARRRAFEAAWNEWGD